MYPSPLLSLKDISQIGGSNKNPHLKLLSIGVNKKPADPMNPINPPNENPTGRVHVKIGWVRVNPNPTR